MNRMIDDLYPSMPWDQLDTIVFDVGNVLLDFHPWEIMENLFPGQKELHQKMYERAFISPYWAMMDRGTLTLAEAAVMMAGNDPELLEPMQYLMANWIEMKKTVPEGVEALYAAKAHGKRLIVLSNYNSEGFHYVKEKHEFFNLFDEFAVSADLHMVKPEMEIYKYVEDAFGIDPARTLFIDDNFVNIEAALHRGWQGFCLNMPGKLHTYIQEQ